MSNLRDGKATNLPLSATSDLRTAAIEPVIAANSAYDLIASNFRTYTAGAGGVTAANQVITCNSGTTALGYGTLQSFRSLNHRAGFGTWVRVSARFPAGVASTWIGAGAFTIGDEVSFGYSGTTFGVWHRYGGQAEIRTLTITGGAVGPETATVTVNGTAENVSLTAGTAAKNASEIAAHLRANLSGWDAYQVGDTVIVNAQSDGAKSDTFAFSSATATGSWAQTTAGVTKTSTHTAQADWNGTVPATFNPAETTDYEIRWSGGYGKVEYCLMDPVTGDMVIVHTIRWNNEADQPILNNPSLHVGAYAASIGSTTDSSVVITEISGGNSARPSAIRNPRAYSNTKSIGTTANSIFTIRTARVYNGRINQSEIAPASLTIANDGTKSAVFEIRGNTTLGGTTNFASNGTNLISEVDTAGTTISGGRLLGSYAVAKGQSVTIDLSPLDIRQPPTLALTISGKMASGSAADLTAALTWYEDIA